MASANVDLTQKRERAQVIRCGKPCFNCTQRKPVTFAPFWDAYKVYWREEFWCIPCAAKMTGLSQAVLIQKLVPDVSKLQQVGHWKKEHRTIYAAARK